MPDEDIEEIEGEEILSPETPETDKGREDVKNEINILRKADIMHSNFEQYMDRFLSAWRIITTQLNQKLHDLQVVSAEERKRYKVLVKLGAHEEDDLPREFVEMKQYKVKILEDVREWQEVAMHLAYILIQKFANVLATTKSLDIEKTALEGQRAFIKDFYERLDRERREEVVRIAQINERQARTFEYGISRMVDQLRLRDALLEDLLDNMKVAPRSEKLISELKKKVEEAEARARSEPEHIETKRPVVKPTVSKVPEDEEEEAEMAEDIVKKIIEMKKRNMGHTVIAKELGVTKEEVVLIVRKLRADGIIR